MLFFTVVKSRPQLWTIFNLLYVVTSYCSYCINAFVPIVPHQMTAIRNQQYFLSVSPYQKVIKMSTTEDIAEETTTPTMIEDEDDFIRDALKRELLFIASVTNRGEYASVEEKNLVIDLITQLEALNPTIDPALNCQGEWDLCLSSTHVFKSSSFFMTPLEHRNENNNNHNNRASSSSSTTTTPALQNVGRKIAATSTQIGRVRQSITSTGDKLINEVDVTIGLLPGVPSLKGTIITSATMNVLNDEEEQKALVELHIKDTKVVKANNNSMGRLSSLSLSNFPVSLEQLLPMTEVYNTLVGPVPTVTLKTCYVDEGIRITRDMGDNFLVFSRATN